VTSNRSETGHGTVTSNRSETGLGASTSPDVAAAAPGVLVVPLGSCEQHGPHLPLDTDTRIAVALAAELVARRPSTALAPALPYGASGEHAGFAGTLSIGAEALEHVLMELGRSAIADGSPFARLVLVCGHGGNRDAVQRTSERLAAEGRPVLAWFPSVAGGDAHAGVTETSLVLALAPEVVRRDRVAMGDIRPLAELLPRLRAEGLRAIAPSGVLGDPTGASAEEGRRLLAALTDDLVEAFDTWVAAP
jgi:creatinine amidohydrolase